MVAGWVWIVEGPDALGQLASHGFSGWEALLFRFLRYQGLSGGADLNS